MRALVILALVVSACGGSGDPTTTEAQSACLAAFREAAGVDSMADSVSDLYPAVRACATVDEWSAAFDVVDGAGFTGSGASVLGNVCTADEVADEPLCQSIR